jgi:hypothetical protein
MRVVVVRESHALEIQQLLRSIRLSERVKQHNSDAASTVGAPPGMTYVDVHEAISRGCLPPFVVTSGPFDSDLRAVLLPGSHVVSGRGNGRVSVRYSSARY